MKLPHPWPAVIVALIATNLVTAAVLVLWSEARLEEEARWAANREKTRDVFALVSDLAGLAEWLELAGNATLPARVRGDAVANATGPALSLSNHAVDLSQDYREANASVLGVWAGAMSLGLARRFFPDIARAFYEAGGPSTYLGEALQNLTRISRGMQGLLYPAAPNFDAEAPTSSYATDPLARLSTAEFAALEALGGQASCLYERMYLGQDLGPCGTVTAP